MGWALSGFDVVTEAATGAYACTVTIAALAGARRVTARTRDTLRHGSARDAAQATLALAHAAGVEDRIKVVETWVDRALAGCDLLTNSGHLRPITRRMIEFLPRHAVIAPMFETWEFRGADLDLAACRDLGIRIAGVNERRPDVGVFPFLGPLCASLLNGAGLSLSGKRIAVICDNPFAPFLIEGLRRAGCNPSLHACAAAVPAAEWSAVVVALHPGRNLALGDADFACLAKAAPGALLAQFWGDIDRLAAAKSGFGWITPPIELGKGHMGILLDALGPEPIIRLQAGGLKAAELVLGGQDLMWGSVAELL